MFSWLCCMFRAMARRMPEKRFASPSGAGPVGADAAARLFDRCGVTDLAQLAGQPWQHLMHILE